ncbi:amino acid permease [Achromobacter piechaudii]|nr:amino acid permease [Achromobacter piechaudii]
MTINQIIGRESGLPVVFSRWQLTVIALGAVISYGVVSGSGFPLMVAGPAAVLSYGAAALIALLMMRCLSELTAAHSTPGAFGSYAEAFLGWRTGFVVRAAYVASVVGIVGTEIAMLESAFAWWFAPLPPALVAGGLLAGLSLVHVVGARAFAWMELAFVLIKGLALLALIVLACRYAMGAADFSSEAVHAASASFMQDLHGFALWQAFAIATMGFIGLEILSIAASETKGHGVCVGRSMRTATRWAALLVVAGVSASAWFQWHEVAPPALAPFVFLLEFSQVPGARLAFSVLMVVTVVSVLNCLIYGASRMLFSMARAGQAPAKLAPASGLGRAIAVVTTLAILVYAAHKAFPGVVYVAVSSIAITALLAIWAAIFLAYFRYRRLPDGAGQGRGSWRGAVGALVIVTITVSTLWIEAFAPTLLYGVPFLILLAVCTPKAPRVSVSPQSAAISCLVKPGNPATSAMI